MPASEYSYCTEVKAEEIIFKWTIKNFSLLLEDTGTAIFSPPFYSENKTEKWKIQLYPRGDEVAADGYVSLYLQLLSSETLPVKVQYELSMSCLQTVLHKRTFIYNYESLVGYGSPKFIERSRLSLYSSDTCIISCKIEKPLERILTSLTNLTTAMDQILSVDKNSGRLTENFAELLEKSKFSDVTIIVEDEKFPAHKLILAARSPVFAAMFENKDMDENKKNEVKIENMEPSVVKGMLEFIYTDNVSNFSEITNGLLLAADKYDLVLLRALCEESLAKTLSNENAFEILVLADLHRSHNLKAHVMHYIDNHLADVIESEGYKQMEEEHPGLLREFIRFMALQKKSKK